MLRGTHFIPTGQQLPRTPPLAEVKKGLGFKKEDQERSSVPFHHLNEGGEGCHPNPRLSISGPSSGHTDSLLTGMKGYRLTAGDLDFMKKMLLDKQTKQLQGELEVVKNTIQREQKALDVTLVLRENVQTDLEKFPSSSELVELLKQVLEIVSPSVQALELDARSLLTMVTKEDVEKALSQKKKAICCMEKEKAWRKENSVEKVQLESQLSDEQIAIEGLMRELSELQSKLAQQQVKKKIGKLDTRSKTALPKGRKPSSNDGHPETDLPKGRKPSSSDGHPETDLPKGRKPSSSDGHPETDLPKGRKPTSSGSRPKTDLPRGQKPTKSDSRPKTDQPRGRKQTSNDDHPKSNLPRGRKPSSTDPFAKTNLPMSPSIATLEKASKATPEQQTLACSKPLYDTRGKPKSVGRTTATASQADRVKKADDAKGRRVQQQQKEVEEPIMVPRRSKRIAGRR
ncbi:uncharacterized protein LOC144073317 isoform X2 [Stigmatopora argus]